MRQKTKKPKSKIGERDIISILSVTEKQHVQKPKIKQW